MHKRTRRLSALSIGVVLGVSAMGLVPTVATAEEPLPPAAVNNPDVPLEIIEALPEVIQNDPDIRIDPELKLGPIVYPDGTPVEGQDAATTAAARAFCGGTADATILDQWGPTSTGDCVVFGSPGWKQGYAWAASDARQNVCVQLRGFNSSGTRTWYAGSCGKSNAGIEVSWGNILANPATRAKSMALLIPNTVSWHI